MNPLTLIDLALSAGIRLGVDGSDLVMEAPAEPPAQLLALIKLCKRDIIQCLTAGVTEAWDAEDWRAFFDERAGIVEFDGGASRAEAEAQAFRSSVAEWLKRYPVASEPGCCSSCGVEEGQGALVLPITCHAVGHVWLHPECWPKWSARRISTAEAELAALGIHPPIRRHSPTASQKPAGQS